MWGLIWPLSHLAVGALTANSGLLLNKMRQNSKYFLFRPIVMTQSFSFCHFSSFTICEILSNCVFRSKLSNILTCLLNSHIWGSQTWPESSWAKCRSVTYVELPFFLISSPVINVHKYNDPLQSHQMAMEEYKGHSEVDPTLTFSDIYPLVVKIHTSSIQSGPYLLSNTP